jgi:hypothetical protein
MSRLTGPLPEPALPRIPWRPFALLLGVAVTLRVALLPLYAYLPENFLDETAWKLWMEQIHLHGFINILRYDNNNYLGYHWFLWGLASIYDVVGGPYTQTTPSLHILVKMPPLIFDVILAFCRLLHGARRPRAAGKARPWRANLDGADAAPRVRRRGRHPLPSSRDLRQRDLGADRRDHDGIGAGGDHPDRPRQAVPRLDGVDVRFMLKPHPIIIAPLLALVTLRQNRWRGAVQACCAVALVAGIVLGPWVLHGDFHRIIRIYRWLFHENLDKLSLSAWNFWWFPDVATKLNPDQKVVSGVPFFTYRNTGLGLSMIALATTCAYWWTQPGLKRTLVACAYLAVAFYMLPISTHERYIYPFVAMLLPVAIIDRRWLWLYAPISATFFINLFISAPPVHSWAGRWLDGPFSLAIASVNVVLFFAFTYVIAKGAVPTLLELRDFGLRRLRAVREPAAAMERA